MRLNLMKINAIFSFVIDISMHLHENIDGKLINCSKTHLFMLESTSRVRTVKIISVDWQHYFECQIFQKNLLHN